MRVVSSLPASHDAFDLSDDRFAPLLAKAEDEHFWFAARNRFIAARLAQQQTSPPATVLDLGCGGGVVAAYLSRRGYRVTGVDGHEALVRQAARRSPGATFLVHDLGQGTSALGVEGQDVAALFDVIEHLEQPAEALRQALACVRPGGLVVGTVPALMSLWSHVDVQAGHQRRYERGELRALLATIAGAHVIEVAPFNRLLVPLLWVQRQLVTRRDAVSTTQQNLQTPPAPLNLALQAALRGEQALSPLLDPTPLRGASLWFALRRAA